jgi:hypothetical protein
MLARHLVPLSSCANVNSRVLGWIAVGRHCPSDLNGCVMCVCARDGLCVCGRASVCGAMQANGTLHALTLVSTVFINGPVCLDDMGCGRR